MIKALPDYLRKQKVSVVFVYFFSVEIENVTNRTRIKCYEALNKLTVSSEFYRKTQGTFTCENNLIQKLKKQKQMEKPSNYVVSGRFTVICDVNHSPVKL